MPLKTTVSASPTVGGFAAAGFYKLSKVFEGKKKIISLIGYAALISIVFFVMPDNPDENTAPVNLVEGFRIMSVLGVSTFWIAIGLSLGFLWTRFNPNKGVPSFN
ncbi:MAG: CbtA family protein [Candidatus Bathyarchaeota archaeon]